MKQFFQWIGKQVATSLITAIFFILAVLGTVYAINYPSAPPVGEVAGGKFMQYFNQIFGQLTFTSTKVVVNPDICTQSGACLSTAAQKIDISGAPVLYDLSSHWE